MLPWCQVKVADRTAVVTANAETMVVTPPGIQDAINVEIGNNIMRPGVLDMAYCLSGFLHILLMHLLGFMWTVVWSAFSRKIKRAKACNLWLNNITC